MSRPDHNPSPTWNAEEANDGNIREGRRGPTILGSTPDFELTPLRFALLLGLLIVAAYPQVVFGLQTFIFRDYGLFGYPIAFYHRECFWRGEIPLWNPLNNCGLPFLAQWNTMVLYPGSLFYLLLPLPWSLGVFCLLHQFLAGLGMFYLARRWTGSSIGASLAGVIFAFNGLTLNCLMWPNNIAGLGWMPWVVLAVECAWQAGGIRVIQAALVGALQMLTGAPEIILLTWFVVAAVFLTALGTSQTADWTDGSPTRRRGWMVGRLAKTALLIGGLSAAQLVPFLALLLRSQRDTGFADSGWAMPGWGWANLLVPLFHGVRTSQSVFLQPEQGWTSSYYLGVTTLVMGAWAAVRLRNARVHLLSGLAGLGLILALGDSGYLFAWLRQAVPWINVIRFPIKWVVLLVFCAPLLAGYAAAAFCRLNAKANGGAEESGGGTADLAGKTHDPAIRRMLVDWTTLGIIAAYFVGLILWFANHYPFTWDDWPATVLNSLERLIFLALMLAVFWSWSLFRRFRWPALGGVVLLMLHWLDIQTHMPNQNPTVSPEVFAPGLPRDDMAPRPALGQSRVLLSREAHAQFDAVFAPDPAKNFLCNRLGLFANANLLDSIPKINGFFSLHLRQESEVRADLYALTNHYPAPLLNFLGVTFHTAPGQIFEWQSRTQAMPLATAGQQPVFADGDATLHSIVSPQFQPRKEVYLSPEIKPFVTVSSPTKATVRAQRWEAQRIELDVEASKPSLVVIAQAFYHNWQAYVDGQRVPLWRANHAFQAVEVPSGRHEIQLRYEDWGFYAGAIVSGSALAGCSLGLYLNRRRSKRLATL